MSQRWIHRDFHNFSFKILYRDGGGAPMRSERVLRTVDFHTAVIGMRLLMSRLGRPT
jgi:hypothetical protein